MFAIWSRGLVTGQLLLSCFVWLLIVPTPSVQGGGLQRSIKQVEDLTNDDVKVIGDAGRRPFLALKDTTRAASQDIQRLYEQSGQASSIAYLLFAAAKPFPDANGSSNPLLPYLTPTFLRLYMSQPQRCSSALAMQLYDLSISLSGTPELQACHFDLYTLLSATFFWVRDNIPLQLQEVPGQPLASAMWPDMGLVPALELAAAVAKALSDTADNTSNSTTNSIPGIEEMIWLLTARCGLTVKDFAALVPDISIVLRQLHADLPLFQRLAEQVHAPRWSPSSSSPPLSLSGGAVTKEGYSEKELATTDDSDNEDEYQQGSRRRREMRADGKNTLSRSAAAGTHPHSNVEVIAATAADDNKYNQDDSNDNTNVGGDDVSNQGDDGVVRRRRSTLTLPSNFKYSFPPSNFVVQVPGLMPQLMIPLVFHIMLYIDGSSVGPAKYNQSLQYVERLVRVANIMAKPTKFQFFIREVRNDPSTYPYLLLDDRPTWLNAPLQNCSYTFSTCFSNSKFMFKNVDDFPRSINVFIASDSTAGVPLGYAYAPGSDILPYGGHVFVSWDSISFDGSNSLTMYDDGPNTLLHELFHHLGLFHPFDNTFIMWSGKCQDGDYVLDTPDSLLPISSSKSFFSTAISYCMDLFWGQYGGNWEATYDRWSRTLGIPEADMNAWADSCPMSAGYDELGNYMTYNTPVCFAALGHFTPGQAQRAHYVTSELNPILYAWGQYYAQNAAPPPPQASPPPATVNDICKTTAYGACACKSTWTYGDTSYHYCDRIGTNITLRCEVADPSTCPVCPKLASSCILSCAGTARKCNFPPEPGGRSPPPPPPPRALSPPPTPPPPPPRSVPSACKVTPSGCECRRTWRYFGSYYSYCASPDGDPTLWCQVSPTCPSFNNSSPYKYCNSSLSKWYCGGSRVYFTTTNLPSAPPAPPPDLRPRSPPPPNGPVATVSGQVVLRANCSLLDTNRTDIRDSLMSELALKLEVPRSYIDISGMSCGSIVVDYKVSFPTGATVTQVYNVESAANSLASSLLALTWGGVSKASSTGVSILQPVAICSAGPDGAAFCPPLPPSPPRPPPYQSYSSSSSGGAQISSLRLFAFISSIVGGVITFIAVTVVIVRYYRRKNSSRVSPGAPATTASTGQQQQQQQQQSPGVVTAWTPESAAASSGANPAVQQPAAAPVLPQDSPPPQYMLPPPPPPPPPQPLQPNQGYQPPPLFYQNPPPIAPPQP